MITPIEKLTAITPLNPEEKVSEAKGATSPGDSPFGVIFRTAVDSVKETDAEFKESQYLLATGQLDNSVATMIAAYKS